MRFTILIGPVVLIMIWLGLWLSELVSPLFVPSPLLVLKSLMTLLISGQIFPDLFATLSRMITGYLLAAILGIPLGVVIGYSKRLYRSTEVVVDFFRSIPATAMFPLFLLFFGVGDTAKVLIVAFSCALIILVNTTYGVKNSNPTRIMVAKTVGANKAQILYKVILPDASPHIFSGLRISLSMALILVIVTEMFIGTTLGLGKRIYDAQLTYRIPEMYSSIILVGTLGYLSNKIFMIFENLTVHWSGK